MALTENESKVLQFIQKDPYISQQEIADQIGLSRSAVANIISNLTEQKLILGRAYIINQADQIVCIGGANVDRKLYSLQGIAPGTSNPARSTQSVGGVARNIAENLGRLGQSVSMITVVGNDSDYQSIKHHSEPFMDLSSVHVSPTVSTGSYTAILDTDGDLYVALADMAAYDQLTPGVVQQQEKQLHEAVCIVADLNCPQDTLQYLLDFGKQFDKPVIFIPVSGPKMARLPKDLNGLTWLITNRDESESYFDTTINNDEDWRQAVENWLDIGIKNIVVTNGKKGVMAGNGHEIIHQPTIEPPEVADVTGAGDAFCGALIDGWLARKPLQEILRYATANAVKTIGSKETVRHGLTKQQLKKDLEELDL